MGFWQGDDIDDHVALGLANADQAERERHYRRAQRDALIAYLPARGHMGDDMSPSAVLAGWLGFLAGQSAEFLLINLEDLWLEAAPQNVPGTWDGAAQLAAQGPIFFGRNRVTSRRLPSF